MVRVPLLLMLVATLGLTHATAQEPTEEGVEDDIVEPNELPDQPVDPAAVDAPPGVEEVPATEVAEPVGAFEAFMESLLAAGYQIDPEAAERVLIESLVETVDPAARIVEDHELDGLREELSGLDCGTVPDGVTNGTEALHLAGIPEVRQYETGHLYVRLSGVFTNTGTVLAEKLVELGEGQHGLILDLRGAAGRSEDQVLRIVSMFPRDQQVAFIVKHYGGGVEEMLVPDYMPVWTEAVVVLVDHETRGAAEVLAAALAGSRSVLLIGTTTSGDGRLRDLVKVSSKYVAYMATRRIVLPDGTDYVDAGLAPDITLEEGDMTVHEVKPVKDFDDRPLSDRAVKIRDVIQQTGSDPAVQRAISILVGLHSLGKSGSAPAHASRD